MLGQMDYLEEWQSVVKMGACVLFQNRKQNRKLEVRIENGTVGL
jgi:hypothetical protein